MCVYFMAILSPLPFDIEVTFLQPEAHLIVAEGILRQR